jgi:glycosyltransferase involved in cell wall biosynthesis
MKHVWNATIVKSQRTAKQLELPVEIIPNGVNLEVFQAQDTSAARKTVGFENGKKYIIWCSNPERPEKDWALAQAAVSDIDAELVAIYNKTPQEVCTYMNAADCLLLTSVSEGSPNVIKEAMACNCPIVTTNVGDVSERLKNLEGCCVVDSREPKELAEAMNKALKFGKRTEGRERIIADQLEISQIAKRIKEIYERNQ